ncbi:helix-turn-helix transcriptional regulator [Micromonospora sp. NPDC005686]|uniref:helix-turn-helix transcriptional regulator n=1 Tax=unclassified Micromonospora TaxID=2617518 RepID=UPI0033A2FFB3
MLETSARLLRLLSLLQTPRDWTGAELAERLAVSTRTVRNDVERLRELGYPVHGTRGAVGGYRLGAGAALPPLLLDDEEAVAVAVGLRTAAGGSVAGIEETSLRALAKLEQVLPHRLRRRVAALHTHTIRVPHDQPGPTVDAGTLSLIGAACRDRERLRFDYVRHDGTADRRDVEPYRLVNWGRRWYLVAFDPARDDWRTFRVDRLTPRTPTGPRFAARELPGDVVDRVRINPAVGTVEPAGDSACLLHTGADRLETIAVWLGLLDLDFTVEDPPELAALLRTIAARYLRAAG